MQALLVVLSVAVILQISSAREDKPTAVALPMAGKIALDGILHEPGWTAAPWQTNFVSASTSSDVAAKPLMAQARFKVVYDDSALFVAMEYDEPNVDKLRAEVTEHDGMVWGDDCVEIFFARRGEDAPRPRATAAGFRSRVWQAAHCRPCRAVPAGERSRN